MCASALVAGVVLLANGCARGAGGTATGSATAAPGAAASALPGDPVHGKAVFTANCSACHGSTGSEGGIGPSLRGERTRKDAAAAIAWIEDPAPPMPKLYPGTLGEKDVTDVAAYVESL